MSKVETIDKIVWVLEQVDVLCGSCDAGERKKLDTKSRQLRQMRKVLTKKIFDENTEEYKVVTEEILQVNAVLQETIEDVEQIAKTLNALEQFVAAIDRLIKAAAKAM